MQLSLPFAYNAWTWVDGMVSGVTGYVPGRSSYNITIDWNLRTYDYCKQDASPGYPLDYMFYNGDCFVAAIANQPYEELRQSWPTDGFYPYSANITTHAGYITLEGGDNKPPDEGPYFGHQWVSRNASTRKSVAGFPHEGRILSVVQDSEYRLELPTFPSWGTVRIIIQ